MNPYRLYRDEWARALSRQATAERYTTFVAMPFREHFSYRSTDVLKNVISAAVDEANRRDEAKRLFEAPRPSTSLAVQHR